MALVGIAAVFVFLLGAVLLGTGLGMAVYSFIRPTRELTPDEVWQESSEEGRKDVPAPLSNVPTTDASWPETVGQMKIDEVIK